MVDEKHIEFADDGSEEPSIRRYGVEGHARVQASLCGKPTSPDELHLCIRPTAPGSFTRQLEMVERAYAQALRDLGFEQKSAVFRRFFLSDAANQRSLLDASPIGPNGEMPLAVSVVEQPPLGSQKLALWAYHIVSDEAPVEAGRSLVVERGELQHIFTTELGGRGDNSSFEQATRVFDDYVEDLEKLGCTLDANAVRTWLFVRDVDRNYAGLVAARERVFLQQGLTQETHYISSTGIEGRTQTSDQLVLMDAYAIAGLKPEQRRDLNAPGFLGKTDDYGVHFERGVRLSYRDRAHLLISGTASIEPSGQTANVGDIEKQVERTCQSIEALLRDGGATPNNLTQLILYVRDTADHHLVEQLVGERWGEVPTVIVHAPVCRPSWLVEIECMAWVPNVDDSLPPF